MQVRLVVVDLGGSRHGLAVDADGATPAEDLGRAVLERFVPADERDDVTVAMARLGDSWTAGTTVGQCRLRHGDVLTLRRRVTPRTPRPRSRWDLHVVGGPEAGRVLSLDLGENVLGRGTGLRLHVDDPLLSRKHLRLDVSDEGAEATDLGSTNGSTYEGQPVTGLPLAPETVVRMGRSLIQVQRYEPPTWSDRRPQPDGTVSFNRPPRAVPLPEQALPDPGAVPQMREPVKLPWQAVITPLLFGSVYFAASPRGGKGAIVMLASAAVTVLVAIGGFVAQRLSRRKGSRGERGEFVARLDRCDQQLADMVTTRQRTLREAFAPPQTLLTHAVDASLELWERRAVDPDFLALRLGFADVPSGLALTLRDGGVQDLRDSVEACNARHAVLHDAPVVVSLLQHGSVGLLGSTESVAATARWLLAQLLVTHSPRDVRVVAAVEDSAFPWLCWVPHITSDDGPATYADAPGASRVLLERLLSLVDERKAAGVTGTPSYVAVLDHRAGLSRGLVSRLLSEGPKVGVHTVWLGNRLDELPGDCRLVVDTDKPSASSPDGPVPIVGVDAVTEEYCWELALALAPVRDTSALRAAADLPERVSLKDLHPASAFEVSGLAMRWSEGRSDLLAPLGTGTSGSFDVAFRRDGPHALLGGTTGAGKSELLQSLVASLALTHAPTRLNFLLVDYKGGAAFKDCADLPHTVGLVTDLDGHLVRRALISLNAELHRRELVLREADCKDLMEMERLQPHLAPANLLILVDEFATLAKELPAFVDGMVDVAQRGRSLGIHLLLATQRPQGVISDNIRGNTNLRMALRVADESDSQDVIGVKDAAHIPRSLPGRAFGKTGQSEIVEFQTAYVGGTSLTASTGPSLRLRACPLADVFIA